VEFEERRNQERFEFEVASEILGSDAVAGVEISWLMMSGTWLRQNEYSIAETAVWNFI
jgi:hypothetical protein